MVRLKTFEKKDIGDDPKIEENFVCDETLTLLQWILRALSYYLFCCLRG